MEIPPDRAPFARVLERAARTDSEALKILEATIRPVADRLAAGFGDAAAELPFDALQAVWLKLDRFDPGRETDEAILVRKFRGWVRKLLTNRLRDGLRRRRRDRMLGELPADLTTDRRRNFRGVPPPERFSAADWRMLESFSPERVVTFLFLADLLDRVEPERLSLLLTRVGLKPEDLAEEGFRSAGSERRDRNLRRGPAALGKRIEFLAPRLRTTPAALRRSWNRLLHAPAIRSISWIKAAEPTRTRAADGEFA